MAYHPNGPDASAHADTQEYDEGDSVTLWTPGLVHDGYDFVGWSENPIGGGIILAAEQAVTMGNTDVNLHARWKTSPDGGGGGAGDGGAEAVTYTVTYHGNNAGSGTPPPDTTDYAFGTDVTVLANTGNLARTGYEFAGWSTNSDGSGISLNADDTFIMAEANVTLYARWDVVVPEIVSPSAGELLPRSSTYIDIEFNVEMNDQGWSFNTTGVDFPAAAGGVEWLEDNRTFRIHIEEQDATELYPGVTYSFLLNPGDKVGLSSVIGTPLPKDTELGITTEGEPNTAPPEVKAVTVTTHSDPSVEYECVLSEGLDLNWDLDPDPDWACTGLDGDVASITILPCSTVAPATPRQGPPTRLPGTRETC